MSSAACVGHFLSTVANGARFVGFIRRFGLPFLLSPTILIVAADVVDECCDDGCDDDDAEIDGCWWSAIFLI